MLFREMMESTMSVALLVISACFFLCTSAKYHHHNQGIEVDIREFVITI